MKLLLPENATKGATIAVVSDLQTTSFVERMLLREQNEDERVHLIKALEKTRPEVLLLLGDHVFYGASKNDWAYVDNLLARLRETGTEILPILGNHDCWAFGNAALDHYFGRFPKLEQRRFYAARLGSLGVIALDSNKFWMPNSLWHEQTTFYTKTLAELEADADVAGILVLVHHPPWTNGTVSGPSSLVATSFVPEYLRARKTMLMLSGHVHAYEHFLQQGRHFLVCGGGGGPRHHLRPAPHRQFEDLFAGPTLRDFHYLTIKEGDLGLDIEAIGLAKGATETRPMDSFQVPWPKTTLR